MQDSATMKSEGQNSIPPAPPSPAQVLKKESKRKIHSSGIKLKCLLCAQGKSIFSTKWALNKHYEDFHRDCEGNYQKNPLFFKQCQKILTFLSKFFKMSQNSIPNCQKTKHYRQESSVRALSHRSLIGSQFSCQQSASCPITWLFESSLHKTTQELLELKAVFGIVSFPSPLLFNNAKGS